MEELNIIMNKALDSTLGTYYRKDAIRKLALIHKTTHLSTSVVKLLTDLEDESLQREVMDIAAKIGINAAVDTLIPISTGKSMLARHAISTMAKIGGRKAYDNLRILAEKPGFDLSKSAASRGLMDILKKEPNIENMPAALEGVGKALFDSAGNFTELVIGKSEDETEETVELPSQEDEPLITPRTISHNEKFPSREQTLAYMAECKAKATTAAEARKQHELPPEEQVTISKKILDDLEVKVKGLQETVKRQEASLEKKKKKLKEARKNLFDLKREACAEIDSLTKELNTLKAAK